MSGSRAFRALALVCAAGLAACGGAGAQENRVEPHETPATPTEAPRRSAESAGQAAMSAEVESFKARRESCDHFRGEEAYDADRAAFLKAKLRETCTGTDAELARLRTKYRDRAPVLQALFDYDDQVE